MKRATVLFGACLTALLVQSATAQQPQASSPAMSSQSSAAKPSGEVQQACAGDMQKFCSDVQASDHQAMGQCMKAHRKDLSAGCKSAWKAAHQAHEAAEQPPKTQ